MFVGKLDLKISPQKKKKEEIHDQIRLRNALICWQRTAGYLRI